MGKIQLLDEETINQIAAGEVIENPASVVKELVENAIDAKATKISVEIDVGGQRLIRVQDNGSGMTSADALLSLSRHATSKIRTHDDLSALVTMGFRGEALSSIAAISEFSMLTAMQEIDFSSLSPVQKGTSLIVRGGKVESCSETNCLLGTEVTVRSLFYNVPARKKFQKSPSRDTHEVMKFMMQLALAHPAIEFDCIANQKKEMDVRKNDLEGRIRELFGEDFVASMKKVDHAVDGYSVSGFIGSPEVSRLNRTGQHLFINKRSVFSFAISAAVKEGFGSAIDATRHPAFVLHLDLTPDLVDVNVHPQKKEVRFQREDEVKKIVAEAVAKALFHLSNNKIFNEDFQPSSALPAYPSFALPVVTLENALEGTAEQLLFQEHQDSCPFRIIGISKEYIFLEMEWSRQVPDFLKKSGLLIMHLKGALSRLAFEDAAAPEKVSTQKLLSPFFIELSGEEARRLANIQPQLNNLGFHIQEFGKSAFLIEGIPATMQIGELESCIRAYAQAEETEPLTNFRKMAEITGRHSCMRTTDLTHEMAREIVKRVLQANEPFICPSGRKIFMVLTAEELEKKFL